MKELKRVSRWITIKEELITEKHSLWCYADKDTTFNERYAYCSIFRWNGRQYAVNQFISRFSMYGFDLECKEYPPYITGYDGERYYNNLYCELDDYGEKIRLYVEV